MLYSDYMGLAPTTVCRFDRQQVHSKRWEIITRLVLDGVSSEHTRRSYSQALEEFLIWLDDQPGIPFDKATIQKYRSELTGKGLAPSSINVRLAAIRHFANEAADNGLLDPEIASAICRIKGARRTGIRIGRWLTRDEVLCLLSKPDFRTMKGKRDRAILALLIGGGLRRGELASLDFGQVQVRDGRWVIVDLVGKHGRIRTIPIPGWTKEAFDTWATASGLITGPVFRHVTRYGLLKWTSRLSPQAIFAVVKVYARLSGLAISPHDLRRTFAKLAYSGDSSLEQIQLSLGHASIVTTEIYLGTKQSLTDAPCDHLGLDVRIDADEHPKPESSPAPITPSTLETRAQE
jgi:integrase/recombinase XerD